MSCAGHGVGGRQGVCRDTVGYGVPREGGVQTFAFGQAMAPGTHDVAVSFLDDAWRGSATTDRDLYVNAVDGIGSAVAGAVRELTTAPTQYFSVVVAAHP